MQGIDLNLSQLENAMRERQTKRKREKEKEREVDSHVLSTDRVLHDKLEGS